DDVPAGHVLCLTFATFFGPHPALRATLSRMRERESGEEAQQFPDDGRESGVDAEEEESEDQGHDHHHDRGRDRFLARRPVDLAGLGADLTDEFAGGDFGHVFACSLLDKETLRGPGGRRSWMRLSCSRSSVQGRGWQEWRDSNP